MDLESRDPVGLSAPPGLAAWLHITVRRVRRLLAENQILNHKIGGLVRLRRSEILGLACPKRARGRTLLPRATPFALRVGQTHCADLFTQLPVRLVRLQVGVP